ncbi:hypothetical protein EI94DRAFT_1717772 [Lactarius quietus]|nr:hypothetical protein EI94DRAFT_1717772 [Lactarius quietus]
MWTERIGLFLTVLTSTPVQLLMLWRCYYILKKRLHFIIPILLLLLGSVALALFDTVGLFWGMFKGKNPSSSHGFWCLLLYSSLCSTLDIILSSILFYYLIQSRKRVYADHAVQWISRLLIILWQSAIPPTLCAVGLLLIYIASQNLSPGEMQMWYPTLQAMIGKLYVLSHFYNINARPLFVGEQEHSSTAYVFTTLTVPALHGTSASALDAPEDHQSISYANSFGRTDSGQP